MSIVSKIVATFKDRRKQECPVVDDRRAPVSARLQAANARVNNAIDDLCQTVSMDRAEIMRRINRE